jgi:hypothetical protein
VSRALEGVLALNALLLLTGLAIVWAARGWRTWLELLGLLGVAYLLGVGGVAVLATVLLVAGGGLSLASILVLCGSVVAACTGIAVWRGRPLPRTFGRPAVAPSLDTALAVAGVVGAAAILVAFLRVARVQPLTGWDAWSFWVPKAKAIYYYGGLDETTFRTLGGPSYPILVPALDAMGFRFMGGTGDPTGLSFQYWLLLVGFVCSSAALLRPFARPWLIWLFLGLATLIPQLDNRLLIGLADWPLDIFFVTAALLLVRWLRTREGWLLAGYGIAVAATLATKREGQLLTACLVAATLLATARRWRETWLPVVGVAALGYAVNVPWRLWWSSRNLEGDAPSGGVHELVDQFSARFWPSLHVVVRVLFPYDSWLLILPVALAAALLSLTLPRAERETAVLFLLTVLLCVLGFTWITWSDPNIPISTRNSLSPIPRAVGSIVLLAAALGPLLLDPLLRRRPGPAAWAEPRSALAPADALGGSGTGGRGPGR